MNLIHLTATQIAKLIHSRQVTSEQATQAFLDRISATDSQVGAFLSVAGDRAIDQARQVDQKIAKGQIDSPLAGVPVAIKDVLCTTDEPTTAASKILKGYVSPYKATVVEKLESAGLVILGKTNLDEFAMGGSTENSGYQLTKNPWDLTRTPGGSSGGSAACIAAAQSPISLGTDTGGSIRQPAAFCGICGLKPTYGRVSRYGLLAFASSLDQIGPMAHSVEDLALLLEVIGGHDSRDSTSIPQSVTGLAAGFGASIAGLKIGIVREQIESEGLDPEIRQKLLDAIEVYRSEGAKIVDVELPNSKYSIATYYIIAPGEASSNLSRYSGAHYGYRSSTVSEKSGAATGSSLVDMYCNTRGEGFGPEVKRRVMLGTYTLSAGYYDAYYLKALKVRRLIRQDFDKAFEQVDLILGPTTPTAAFPIGEKTDDPVQMYLVDLFTVGANLAGIPALAIPNGQSKSGLPIGMQLQAAPLREDLLLHAGHAYQSTTQHQPTWPTLS